VVAEGKILGDEAAYDGVAALYFPTEKEARASEDKNSARIRSPWWRTRNAVRADRRHAQADGPAQGDPDLGAQAGSERRAVQGCLAQGLRQGREQGADGVGIQRIVASFTVPEKDKEPAFDVMLEIYFATSDEVKAAFASPVIGQLRKDEETLVRLDAPEIRIVAEEHVL